MDGPYQIYCQRIEEKLVRLSFDNDYSFLCDEKRFVKCIIDTANKLLDYYIRTGYLQKSIDVLRDNIANATSILD